MFFSTDENKKTINKALNVIKAYETEDEFLTQRNRYILMILNAMKNEGDAWDKASSITIKWLGNQFISRLLEAKSTSSTESIDELFAYCFRFLQEFYLSIKVDLSRDFERARIFAIENIDKFSDEAKSHIKFALHDLPTVLFKELLSSDEIGTIKDFNLIISEARDLKEKWELDISQKETRIKVLKESLDQAESNYNFVGLNHGFQQLAKKKIDEQSSLSFWLKVFGFLITLPIISELIFIYTHLDNLEQYKNTILLSLIPASSLVIIFIYYFRLLMVNYKSVVSQLLQIELRMTLCQFIQSYATYSSEIKGKDKDLLTKFENIIFSGIVSDESKLPSTFDGLESVSAFIKSLKT
jgi:hypothetical protein